MKLLKKYSNILISIILALQLLLLAIAIEVGGWFLVLYIVIQLIWTSYWVYKNWWLLKSIREVILYSAIGKKYLDYKVKQSRKHKK